MSESDPAIETPAAVFAALVEAYRQAAQDAIYSQFRSSHPESSALERASLARLHAACDGWQARYARAQAPNKETC